MKYDPRFHVVLHQPEIPHNTGSVGRTCVAVGAKLWLVRPLGFRVDDYYLRRAGLDYWEHLEWEVADDWDELCRRLALGPSEDRPPEWGQDASRRRAPGVEASGVRAAEGRRAYYFTKKAASEYTSVAYRRGDVFVFGCETSGLPQAMLEANAERTLRIPTRSEVRSLNLSNAVAVCLYEALRQVG